jgi:two-component system sensor histidine kinase KdpD
MKPEPTDLFDAVAGAVHDTRASLAGHEVKVEIPPDIPFVRLDPVLLHHCLINLLDNAGRYAHPGTAIIICGTRDPDAICLSVVDQGPGIPPGQEARVFETFTRLEGSDRVRHGTGLGLAIVKGFAEAMGLSVQASNRDDPLGACFTIRIPRPLIMAHPGEKETS